LAGGDSVALVADRPVGGSGTLVELFGAPARLPAGPAVLALESGVPAWLAATRRVGFVEYRTRLERVEVPTEGTRRERLTAFMAAEAAAFERAIADAPEQWWTLFFPIWEDAVRSRAQYD
jgi:KDO2-lipid IV(A) lauroyltransferase